ncbi:hypothetical protein AB0L40_10955 [Patulibacter sp. NPDC049589]|uniref:hypothetical protein n=1 Tax=Patulibacter sp. NPDC049589 TaxID=3154731 RepID=UPI003428E44E
MIGTSNPRYRSGYGSVLREAIYSLDCRGGGEVTQGFSLSAGFRGIEFGIGTTSKWTFPRSCSFQNHRFTVKVGYSKSYPPKLLTPEVYFPQTNSTQRIRFTSQDGEQKVLGPDGKEDKMATTPRGFCRGSNASSNGICRSR